MLILTLIGRDLCRILLHSKLHLQTLRDVSDSNEVLNTFLGDKTVAGINAIEP